MAILTWIRDPGSGSRRDQAFTAASNGFNYAGLNAVPNKLDDLRAAGDAHPKTEALGVFLFLDGTTNGFGMTADTIDFFLSNDGVANGSLAQFGGEGYEILEETNDVAFNWADMLAELGKNTAAIGGTTEDGNIAYWVADGLENITEAFADTGEVAKNVYEGDGFHGEPTEWYESNYAGGDGAAQDPGTSGEPGNQGTDTPEPTEDTYTETEDQGTQEPTAEPTQEAGTDYDFGEVFDLNDQEALRHYFSDLGTVESMEIRWEGSENGSGNYVLEATGENGTKTFDLVEDGAYSSDGQTFEYSIDGEEMQEIVQAKEAGETWDLFDESEYVPNQG